MVFFLLYTIQIPHHELVSNIKYMDVLEVEVQRNP